jgi:hypothetical protein
MEKWTLIIILCLLLLIVAAVIILIVFREEIFNIGKSAVKKGTSGTSGTSGTDNSEELKAKGYGTYYKAYETPCITTNGKCNTAGVKYITEYCAPHSETKNGCLNDNGEMTFAPRTINELCQPNCRSYVLKETTLDTNVCSYDAPYNLPAYTCVPPNAQMFEYRTYECIKNDSIGDNTCTYACNTSGIDSAGIPGDTDPSKQSYIPACAKNPGKTITLNTFNWNTYLNIGNDPNKGLTSKGYTISNILLSNGKVDSRNFNISPPYPPWSDSPSNVITLEELKILDSTLTVYDNCSGEYSSSNQGNGGVKPLCENWYYAKPLESLNGLNLNLTYQKRPELCTLDSNFIPMKECFYTPWNSEFYTSVESSNFGAGSTGNASLIFINPYTKTTPGITGNTGGSGKAYSWIGIGNYGYYTSPMICEKTPKDFNPYNGSSGSSGSTGVNDKTYLIPSGDEITACLNLSAPPSQCANSLNELFAVTPSQNLASLIKELDSGSYNPEILNSYPGVQGDTYYTCRTQYTNKINDNRPGCVQTCQYIPPNDSIDFSAPDFNGNFITNEIQELIGGYITLSTLGDEGNFFLGTQNVPCNNLSNSGVPLMNCNSSSTAGASGYFYPTPCAFVYSGGTGIDAGNWWSKNGCDAESITLASSLRLIISPASVYGVLGPGDTGNSILCDIYGEIDGNFGYLSPSLPPSNNINVPDLNISSYFTYDGASNTGNIIANSSPVGSTGSGVYFNALVKGQNIPSTTNNGKPHFILSYNPSNYLYTVSSSNPYFTNLKLDLYTGNDYTSSAVAFEFSSLSNININPSLIPVFYTKTAYDSPIIKSSGLYAGYDITRSITLQRNTPCYTKKMCLSSGLGNLDISGSTGLCYDSTCNLYFNYNPEFC